MKTYKNYRTAIRHTGRTPIAINTPDGLRWTAESVKCGGDVIESKAFSMMLGGSAAESKFDRTFELVRLGGDWLLRTRGVAGCEVYELFPGEAAARSALAAKIADYSVDSRWLAR